MTRPIVHRSIRLAAAFLVASAGGCSRGAADVAPPRADDRIAVPVQNSVIAVPVEARLAALSRALEREVPRELWSIDRPNQTCLPPRTAKVLGVTLRAPRIRCRIVGRVTRGPMALSGSGEDLVVTMPIHAEVSARDVGGILKQETATGDARIRAIVRLSLTRDWQPRVAVRIAYDWTREPGIDFLGQRIVFTSRADAKLKGVVARLERTLPRQLASLNVRGEVDRVWAKAFTALELNRANPPVWMRVTPQQLRFGGYAIQGDRLRLNLGLAARTETFVGPRPEDPACTPLPPLAPMEQNPGKILFYIPVIADYRELEPVVLRALVKRSARPFVVPGLGEVDTRFSKVTVYGTTGGRIAVGVEFAAQDRGDRMGRSSGTVWITGLPVNQANSRRVAFTDLQVTGTTDSTGADLLVRLANAPGLAATIAQALAQNFEKDFTELLGKVERAITEKREGDFVIRARVTDIRTGELRAAGQGLYLPVTGVGTASIALLPR